MKPELGKPAPAADGRAFWLGYASGEMMDFHLADYRGKNVILAFYPGDFTPVCTTELCDFRDNIAALANLNALVVGISTDTIEKHAEFARKYNLTFPLIDDSAKKIGEAYGVSGSLFSSSHKRALFVIDAAGNLVWKKVELTTLFRTEAGQVAKVLASI